MKARDGIIRIIRTSLSRAEMAFEKVQRRRDVEASEGVSWPDSEERHVVDPCSLLDLSTLDRWRTGSRDEGWRNLYPSLWL